MSAAEQLTTDDVAQALAFAEAWRALERAARITPRLSNVEAHAVRGDRWCFVANIGGPYRVWFAADAITAAAELFEAFGRP